MDYLTNPWNINDLTYLSLNSLVMLIELFGGHVGIVWQFRLAAVANLCMWIKVFDWLRIFDDMAFFVQLIITTIYDIRSFIVILLFSYIMFGSSFYILNLGIPADGEYSYTPDLSRFWVIDAFQS